MSGNNFATPFDGIVGIARFVRAYGLIFLLFVLNIISIPVLQDSTFKIPLMLMAIYYWAIYRPTLLPSWLVFAAGIVLDALIMMPLGLNALIFIAIHKLLASQRRFLTGQSFMILWFGFAVIYAIAIFMMIAIASFQDLFDIDPLAIGFTYVLSVLIFPFIVIALHMTHKHLPSPVIHKSIALHKRKRF